MRTGVFVCLTAATLLGLYAGCATSPSELTSPPDAAGGDDAGPDPDASQSFPETGPPDTNVADGFQCPSYPGTDAGVLLAPAFQKDYVVYDIGAPPGVPDPLGGTIVDWKDDNTLLIAGASEDPAGALYSIKIKRDACGHVLGWNGTATQVAKAPMIDANLLYFGANADAGTGPLMLYSEWPNAKLGQLLPNGNAPARETDLTSLGIIPQGSFGGIGFVPPGLNAVGELRGMTYPVYNGLSAWHHIKIAADGNLVKVVSVTKTLQVCDGCGSGGFAYVPAGSPDFPKPSILVAEWNPPSLTRVSGYNVDQNGDPIVNTRFDFLTNFLAPWGAYFDRVSGDYLFLQWQFTFNSKVPDHVFVVRGFNKPPEPPPPPN